MVSEPLSWKMNAPRTPANPPPEFGVERLFIVLPVQHDPHVDPVVAHRGPAAPSAAFPRWPPAGLRTAPWSPGCRSRRRPEPPGPDDPESIVQPVRAKDSASSQPARNTGVFGIVIGGVPPTSWEPDCSGQGVLGLLAIQPPKVKRRASRQPARNTGSFGIVIGGTSLTSGRDPSVCGVFRPHKGRCSPETLHARSVP